MRSGLGLVAIVAALGVNAANGLLDRRTAVSADGAATFDLLGQMLAATTSAITMAAAPIATPKGFNIARCTSREQQ